MILDNNSLELLEKFTRVESKYLQDLQDLQDYTELRLENKKTILKPLK